MLARMWGNWNSSSLLIEGSNGATTVGHRLVPLKSKHWITIRCGSFTSRQTLKKIEREMQIHRHSTTFMVLFTEAKRWETVYASPNRVTDKQNASLHGMIRALAGKGFLKHATACMNLQYIC